MAKSRKIPLGAQIFISTLAPVIIVTIVFLTIFGGSFKDSATKDLSSRTTSGIQSQAGQLASALGPSFEMVKYASEIIPLHYNNMYYASLHASQTFHSHFFWFYKKHMFSSP